MIFKKKPSFEVYESAVGSRIIFKIQQADTDKWRLTEEINGKLQYGPYFFKNKEEAERHAHIWLQRIITDLIEKIWE
jgi:hypothetical protein